MINQETEAGPRRQTYVSIYMYQVFSNILAGEDKGKYFYFRKWKSPTFPSQFLEMFQ